MQYDILPGRGHENAKKALALAVERGFEATEVLTFRDGYYVPVDAPDEVQDEESTDDKDEAKGETPEDEKPAPKTARKPRTAKKE